MLQQQTLDDKMKVNLNATMGLKTMLEAQPSNATTGENEARGTAMTNKRDIMDP